MSAYNGTLQVRASGINHQPFTLAKYQATTRTYLQKLRQLDEKFCRLSVLGHRDFEPLSADLSDLDARILDALCGRVESELGPSSISRNGFSVTFFSHSDDEARSHLPVSSGGVEIVIDGVSEASSGGVLITLPPEYQRKASVLQHVKRLLEVTLEVWPFRFGAVRTIEFQQAIQRIGDLHSGQWLTFLPIEDLGMCLPIEVERQHFDSGTLVVTTPHLPQVADLSDVAAGKRVREALDNLGLVWHSTYAIHGWPPDEEEWRYEEFISGAPRGRKYRVRCIDFDGYDADRQVLLYAKLFRQLRQQRKEWGLRGWDGPVLNEAKRQVRAANGTQIEWHVGLEEPASRVRALLADYTNFTEQQLRVVYTPVSQALGS